MPPSYMRQLGIEGVVAWAKEWRADVVIAQFDPEDDVSLFRKNGIVALAQDYISKFCHSGFVYMPRKECLLFPEFRLWICLSP